MLPESLRYHLEEQAEELQVPLSSLAAPSIAGLAALIGEKVTIQPKRHNPSFRVAAPTWSMIVGDPGAKKTQVLKVALEPLLAIEKQLSKENQAMVAERGAEMKALALREKDLEGRLGLVQKSGDTETASSIMKDLVELHHQRTEVARKGSKQIIVREATPEKLLEILVQNPNGVVQMADEIPGWWRSLKTNYVDMRKMFLEGWGGFEILLQRKHYTLAGRSILSVIGGAQSDWVQKVVEDIKAGKDNDGLLHRFGLLINHEPPLERWKLVHKPRNEKAREFYHGIFNALHDMTTADIIPGYCEGFSNAICFSEKAEEIFFTWLDEKENEIREEGFPRILAAHLSKYTSLFASLSLIFHLVLYFEGACSDPNEIGEAATKLAKKWCDYLSAHARRTFLSLKSHPLAVRTLAKLILQRKIVDRTSFAEVLSGSYKHLPDEVALRQAVKYLADRQILRVERQGRCDLIRLNPRALRNA